MFEKKKAQKAAAVYQTALAAWEHERTELVAVLQAAKARSGSTSTTVVLKSGEAVFAKVTNTSLVEMRKGAGHWQGGSQGVSIPIGSVHGRSVRYRVGTSKGHYVQGEPHPQAVDKGELNITNKRIVFCGAAKTIECSFEKLVSIQQTAGQISVSVSNRQKPTVLHYGSHLDGWMKLRLALALAIFRGETEPFIHQLEENLQHLEAERPTVPALQR